MVVVVPTGIGGGKVVVVVDVVVGGRRVVVVGRLEAGALDRVSALDRVGVVEQPATIQGIAMSSTAARKKGRAGLPKLGFPSLSI
jgi:translation elongation factor EF-Tu-like GTPase